MGTSTEVYKQRREVQNKYTYLLIAVAASAIALSLKRTTGLKITTSMIPLALAVLCWGLSFFFGCLFLRSVDAHLGANLHKLIGSAKTPAQLKQLDEATAKYSKKCKSSNSWQFYLLICGALFFISWHIIEMIKLTVNTTG